MTQVARTHLYQGKTFTSQDGEHIWEAIEGHVSAMGDAQGLPDTRGVVFSPPLLSLMVPALLRVGAFSGRSLGNPLVQNTTQDIPYGTATHGGVQGSTAVTDGGASRTVVVLARYERLEQGEATNARDVPVPLLYLHGVAYRVIASEQVAEDVWTEPGSLAQEILEGSLPIAAIKRTPDGDVFVPLLNNHVMPQNVIAPLSLVAGLGSLAVREGEYDFTFTPPVNVVADGNAWRVTIGGDDPWYAPLLKGLVTHQSQGRIMFGGVLSTSSFEDAGTYIARLQYDDTFPGGPILVLADGSGIAQASGDSWDQVNDRGYAVDGEGGFYTAQPFDIPVAVVTYNGDDDPQIVPIKNGPLSRWSIDALPAYSVGQSSLDPDLNVIVTLPDVSAGGQWAFEVDFHRVDENNAPPGLGHPHDLRYEVLYVTFNTAMIRLSGQWSAVGENGELSLPSSLRFFRPGATINITRHAPSML